MLPDKEMREFLYSTIIPMISIFAVFIYSYFQINRKKKIMGKTSLFIQNRALQLVEKHRVLKPFTSLTFLAIIETTLFPFFQYLPVPFLSKFFGDCVGTGTNYFGALYFVPVFMLLGCIVLWVDPIKSFDLLTPAFPLALSIVKVACFTSGCCYGVWWPGGPYSYRNEREEFPVQLLESGVALLIFIFLMWYKKKAPKGTMFPMYIIIYSATRFITEFWRGQELVWGPLRFYHILCIVGFVLGIIEFAIVLKYNKKISLYFENTFYFSRKRNQKLIKKGALKS